MNDTRARRLILVAAITLIAALWYGLFRKVHACEARGGVLVTGVAQFHCVKELP